MAEKYIDMMKKKLRLLDESAHDLDVEAIRQLKPKKIDNQLPKNV